MNKATVVFPIKDGKILLARKMKKIGAGKWNGFGGKPEPSDISIRHTACRELFEETGFGVCVQPEKLIPKAEIDFFVANNESEELTFTVYFYFASEFEGGAKETKEMHDPTWFQIDSIPYEEMLPADREFIPKLFEDGTFYGKVVFNKEMDQVIFSHYEERLLTM